MSLEIFEPLEILEDESNLQARHQQKEIKKFLVKNTEVSKLYV